jgi:hypothetical protein
MGALRVPRGIAGLRPAQILGKFPAIRRLVVATAFRNFYPALQLHNVGYVRALLFTLRYEGLALSREA